jgi:hypothetical protein
MSAAIQPAFSVALIALVVLLLGTFAGLLLGSWRAVSSVALAIPAGALLGGPDVAALGVLGVVGCLAGLQLHRAVAEQYVPR